MDVITIKRLKAKVEGDKRQYAPFTTCWTCPDCGKANEIDHTDHYFSYPTFGEDDDFNLFCQACDEAGKEGDKGVVRLRLDMVLSLASKKETPVMMTPAERKACKAAINGELAKGKENIALQSLLNKLS